jgi:menaquinone-dependent protoporphyrinogen IX oxidase
MNKNIEKFINCIPDLNNLFEKNLNLNKLKNCIIKNIIKSNKYELFFCQNLKNHTNIFNDFDNSLLILNFSENNKNASKYIINKIKELFCQNDDNQLFRGFLKNSIINQYAFDTILKIISKNKDKNFIEANKLIFLKSLNEYCIKNAYY